MKRLTYQVLVLLMAGLSVSCSPAPGTSGQNRESAPAENQPLLKTAYTNPVLDSDFPDPTVVKGHDGWFYAYATQGDTFNIQVARSADLVNWEHMGDALPNRPRWGDQEQAYWAPHVLYDQEKQKYFMYFSAESDDANTGKCLAVAVSDSPLGPFEEKGEPLLCGEGFVNIDPMAFDDPGSGKKLLYWGSGFKPVVVQELSDDRLHFKPGTQPKPVVHPGKDKNYSKLIEGAWVTHRNGKYYLYYSGDNCCGEKANYAVMAARADQATGPFVRLGEANGTGSSVILAQKDFWKAPGHNSIITDQEGNEWIFYHAMYPEKKLLDHTIPAERKNERIMLLDRIVYQDGWPMVEDHTPTQTKQAGPAVPARK